MIRWSYLIPRLLIALTLFVTIHFGAPSLLHWVVVRTIQTTTGADVQIGAVWTSLPRAKIQLGALQIARTPQSDTNLLTFDAAQCSLDLTALAHQQYVLQDAQIHGLRFSTARRAGVSATPDTDAPAIFVDPARQQLEEHARKWLRQVASLADRRVEEEFESLRVAREWALRWPDDYRRLVDRAQQLRQRAIDLHQRFSQLAAQRGGANQLNGIHQLHDAQQLWSEVIQMREDLAAMQQHALQLAQQVQQDRQSMTTALQHDRDNLQEKMRLVTFQDQRWSDLLLDNEMRHWWHQAQPWLELAQWLTSSPAGNQLGERGRIVEYDTQREPDYLIRSAQLDGELLLAGHLVSFVGQAKDLTLPGRFGAEHLVRPTQLKLVTQGPFTAELFAQFDRLEGRPRQQVAVRCDALPVTGRVWGHTDGLSLTVKPSTIRLQARLLASQGRVDGRIRIIQSDLDLVATAPADVVPPRLLMPLNEAASRVKQLDLWIDVAGPADSPQLRLQSTFGSQLQEQLQVAAEQFVQRATQELLLQADEQFANILRDSQQQLANEQAHLQQQLDTARQLLTGLAEPVASRFQPLGQLLQRF